MPDPVARPLMVQRWTDVTYLHWPVAPADVARLLPPGLDPDTLDGSAWVGLVPFVMRDLTLPGFPAVPWLSEFAETNVRTYVVGPAGPGVWFCSLDAQRLPAVVAAMVGYRLAYRWARMRVGWRGTEIRFSSSRRWPGPRGARSLVGADVGAAVEPDALDTFHTDCWGVYCRAGGRLLWAPVAHEPWPLRAAALTVLDEDLVAAAGLRRPDLSPRVRFGGTVHVLIGRPRVVRS